MLLCNQRSIPGLIQLILSPKPYWEKERKRERGGGGGWGGGTIKGGGVLWLSLNPVNRGINL